MGILWQLLVQFIFRVTFGMALAMALTPARLVTSGYYRIQLWVLMGLNTVAALALFTTPGTGATAANSATAAPPPAMDGRWVLTLAVAATVLSYVGSACWLYERRVAGKVALLLVSLTGLLAAIAATSWPEPAGWARVALEGLDLVSSGLLLGTTLAAMLLGHWYLNSPTMSLLPLSRLILVMLAAVALRTAVCGTGLALQMSVEVPPHAGTWMFLACRWLAGLVGTAAFGTLAWYTLKVPNTQSATGILYAAVILTFIGELVSQLLSASLQYPV